MSKENIHNEALQEGQQPTVRRRSRLINIMGNTKTLDGSKLVNNKVKHSEFKIIKNK